MFPLNCLEELNEHCISIFCNGDDTLSLIPYCNSLFIEPNETFPLIDAMSVHFPEIVT